MNPRIWADVPGFLRDGLGFLTGWARSGKRCPMRLGRPVMLLTDPEDVRHVFRFTETRYGKSPAITGASGRALLGESVLTLDGEQHRERRIAVQKVLSPNTLEPFSGRIRAAVERRVATWPAGGVIESGREMRNLAREMVLDLVLGEGAGSGLEETLRKRQRELERALRWRMPVWTPARRRRLESHIEKLMEERQGHLVPERSLLDRLMQVLPAGSARQEAMSMLMSGHETASEALTWTLWLIAAHPAECEGAEASAIFSEALRLYPPTWLVVREARTGDQLPSGLPVNEGQTCYLSQWVTHRDERYHPGAERFDPGRLLEHSGYFPFGSGTRVCPGKGLAMWQACIVIDTIRALGRLEAVSAAPPRPSAGLNLSARDPIFLRWRLEKR